MNAPTDQADLAGLVHPPDVVEMPDFGHLSDFVAIPDSADFADAAWVNPESSGASMENVLMQHVYPLLLTTWAGMSSEGLSPASTNASSASPSSNPALSGYYSQMSSPWSNPNNNSYAYTTTTPQHQHHQSHQPQQQQHQQQHQQHQQQHQSQGHNQANSQPSYQKLYDGSQMGYDARFSRSPGSNPEAVLPPPYEVQQHQQPQQQETPHHQQEQHNQQEHHQDHHSHHSPQSTLNAPHHQNSPYARQSHVSLAPVHASHHQHASLPSPQPPTLTSNGPNVSSANHPGQPISLDTYKIQSPIQTFCTPVTTTTTNPFSSYAAGAMQVSPSALSRGLPSLPHQHFGAMQHYSQPIPSIGRPIPGMAGHGSHLSIMPALPQHVPYMSQVDYIHVPTPSDRPFRCDQCPQAFNRNHDLKRHKRIHLSVKPFPCTYCDKSFSRKDALKRHRHVKGCAEKANSLIREQGRRNPTAA
ncbi:Zinc finger, C2H2-type/integrase, DNA-binding protein [Ceratocystis lukuohia]|uniref:Zinc finger, C2H2-type/integrase, DNA-binding protein n=1 Tax=Ceratocystis lukuohia TaxID=2019550 RepID=A0ABR4MBY8_9PEZI